MNCCASHHITTEQYIALAINCQVYYNETAKAQENWRGHISRMDLALARIQKQAATLNLRVTQHAQIEMDAESITLDDVLKAIANGTILEDYSEHLRGPCCLLYGRTKKGRHLHIVCTTAQSVLIIITVYEPLLPKWVNPTQRRER